MSARRHARTAVEVRREVEPRQAPTLKDTRRTRFARWKRPVPTEYPEYDHAAGHTSAPFRIEVYPKIDAFFVLLATVMSLAVAWIFLREGITTNPKRLVNLVVFWVVFTYVALPRIHQSLTRIYVPDYFIGRTRTADGLLGDPVNIAFEGSEDDIHVAMRRAGWTLAEENTLHSARKMVMAFLFRRSYPQAPVSSLFLFGRRHEFAYQQEVGGTTVKRHHIRFWRAPSGWIMPGGHRATWLGAATYDRSVGLSRFTFQVTHKIDENTDVERDYVVDTLLFADPEIPVGVIKDYSTSYHHRNGGGDPLRTDGHLPLVDLTGAQSRSDGSTAVLQPRNRATGVSYLKGRSIRPQAFVETLQNNWHGTIDDVSRMFDHAGDHHLPPPSILFTGAMLLLQSCVTGYFAVQEYLALDAAMQDPDARLIMQSALGLLSVIAVALIVTYVLLLRRNRWARLVMMALLAFDSTVRITEVWSIPTGQTTSSDLIGVGLSTLALMALTSDAARLWVYTDRLRQHTGSLTATPLDDAADASPPRTSSGKGRADG